MCGIWGSVGTESEVSIQTAWQGLCALTDRGPDDWGLYTDVTGKITDENDIAAIDCTIALGNRRLSILDLSAAGNQPMTVDGRYWLVYNGEVYNYRELRRDLREKGYAFDSDSDTEVVLRAYQEYGSDCVERFRGMFAFAIWDTATDRLFAARDRFGIKPFYYDVTGDGIAFASEVTSLLDAGVTTAEVDPVAVDGFLALGSVPAPRTIVRDVRSLPPGSTLEYDRMSDENEVRRYWKPTFDASGSDEARDSADSDDNDLPQRVRELLEESVKLRMRSDVPVGAFLSGGLDSSAIVAAMEALRESSEPLHTFSIDFDDTEHSEGEFAREVAEHLGTEHHAQTVTAADVREKLLDIVAQMDQPTVDGINTFFVSQLAAQSDVSVALSGLGSDELFYGYPTFRRVPQLTRAMNAVDYLPSGFRAALATTLDVADDILPMSHAHTIADMLRSSGSFGPAYVASRGLFTRRQRERLTRSEAVTDWGETVEAEVTDAIAERDLGDVVSFAELTWYMHNQLLRDTDTMSMAHSLEVRVPFLDAEFASTVASVTPDTKREGEKELLKDAVSDMIPSTVLTREKTGFTFPFDEWLSEELTPVVDDALSDSLLSATPVDGDNVEWVRQEYEKGNLHWSRLWALVVLSLWIDTHISGNDSSGA